MKDLSSAERRALRARAHSLNAVVMIGNGGLTPGVMAEVERSLKAHELIKIRVGGAEHAGREAMCEAICGQTGAAAVQHIGKVLVIYRERPEERAAPKKPRARLAPADIRVVNNATARSASKSRSGASKFSGPDRGRSPRG